MKIILYVLLICSTSFAELYPYFYGVNYTIDTPTITVSWFKVEGAAFYDVRLVLTDTTPETYYNVGYTSQTEMTINKPKTGSFKVQVRAFNDNETSEWADSTIDGYSMNYPVGWKFYWKVLTPSWE